MPLPRQRSGDWGVAQVIHAADGSTIRACSFVQTTTSSADLTTSADRGLELKATDTRPVRRGEQKDATDSLKMFSLDPDLFPDLKTSILEVSPVRQCFVVVSIICTAPRP